MFFRDKDEARPRTNLPLQVYLDKSLTQPAEFDRVITNREGNVTVYITCKTDKEETYYVGARVVNLADQPYDTPISYNGNGELRYAIHYFKPGHPIITGNSR